MILPAWPNGPIQTGEWEGFGGLSGKENWPAGGVGMSALGGAAVREKGLGSTLWPPSISLQTFYHPLLLGPSSAWAGTEGGGEATTQ